MGLFFAFLGIVLLYFSIRNRKAEIEALTLELNAQKTRIRTLELEAKKNQRLEEMPVLAALPKEKVVEPIVTPVISPLKEAVVAPIPALKTEPVSSKEIPSEEVPPPLPETKVPESVRSMPEAPIAPPPVALPSEPPSIPWQVNWEMFMGAKMFAWIGGVLLFIGVSFFIKYSLDHNLIPAEVRAAICYLIGGGLIGGGLLLSREKYPTTVHALCGTGVLILYGITFACRSYYHFDLFTPVVTFGWMILITVVAFLIAIRLEAKAVAVMGIFGGFLTPFLISTGSNNPMGLFSYIAILNVGLIAVALVQRWGFVVVLGAVGTVLMELGWGSRYLTQSAPSIALNTCLLFNVLFGLGAYVAHRRERLTFAISLGAVLVGAGNFLWACGFYSYLQATPLLLFGVAFAASLLTLGITLIQRELFWSFKVSGGIALALLWTWTVQKFGGSSSALESSLLYTALGLHFTYAVLHTVLPMLFASIRESRVEGKWLLGFSLAMLFLCLWLPFQSATVPWMIWGLILSLNLLIAVVSVLFGVVTYVLIAGVSTMLGAGACILGKPGEIMADQLLPMMSLATGLSVVFFAAGLILRREIRKSQDPEGETISASGVGLLPAFSVFSASWPYLLIATVCGGMELASPSTVFGVVLLMNILLLGLSRHLFPSWLPGMALAGTALVQGIWYFKSYHVEMPMIALIWAGIFHLLFTLFPFVFRRAFLATTGAWITSAVAGPVAFALYYGMTKALIPSSMGGTLPTIFAVTSLLWLVICLKTTSDENPIRLSCLAWYGGIALLFITMIFPMQFSHRWLTVSWALEGMALFWLFRRVRHSGLPATGFVLLAVCLARILMNAWSSHAYFRAETVFMNSYLFDYALMMGALWGARFFVIPPSEEVFGLPAKRFFEGALVGLAFVLMNLGINDCFTRPGAALTLAYANLIPLITVRVVGMAWFAVGLLYLARRLQFELLRYLSFALLAASAIRLITAPSFCEPLIRGEIPFFNWHIIGFGALIGALWMASRLWSEAETLLSFNVRSVFKIGIAVSLFVFMNLQVMDFFTNVGGDVVFSFRGSLAQDMTYTIAWTLFALGLVFLGLLKRVPYARYSGMALVGVSLLKLFFHDLSRLDQLYRIGAFIAVAVMMMLASFFYQKFVSALDEKKETP